MRAVVVARTGGPEVLEVRELPDPQPAAGEVVVSVAAAGVNFIDIYQRMGRYPLALPFVAGSEGAGEVRAVGADVRGVAVGDHVGWAGVNGAGYAELVAVPADQVVALPAGVDDRTAAAVLLQGMTAQYLCVSTYPVQPGDDVLVHAGAGGVGLLLTQLVTRRGGRVLATTSSDEKAALCLAAGAAEVIRYDQVDVASEVRRLTGGAGVAVVYDGVGADTFAASLDCLRRRGMLVLFGGSSGPVPSLDPQVLNAKGSLFLTRPKMGDYLASRAELEQRAGDVLGAVADGSLQVRVGATFALDEARAAHEALAGRRTTGKVLLIP